MNYIIPVSCWMVASALFYVLACYYAFYFKPETDLPKGTMLDSIQPHSWRQIFFAVLAVAVVMSWILFVMVRAIPIVPTTYKSFSAAVLFLAVYLMPSFVTKISPHTTSGRALFFLVRLILAGVALYIWTVYPNWMTNNLGAFVSGFVIVVTFRNTTWRQCVAVCGGIMIFDATSVFASGDMNALASMVSTGSTSPQLDSAMKTVSMIVVPQHVTQLHSEPLIMCGLGDLVLPSILVMYACRTHGWFGALGTISGYLVGMVVTLIVLLQFDVAQPATIYLIPMSFLGLVAVVSLKWLATMQKFVKGNQNGVF